MPRVRAQKDDDQNDAPKAAPACLVTVTGPVKGHPPVTIECYGPTPKDAVNAVKKLIAFGTIEVIS